MVLKKISQNTFDFKENTGVFWFSRVDVNQDGLQDFIIYVSSLLSFQPNIIVAPSSFIKIHQQQIGGNFLEMTNAIINNKSPIMGVNITLANFNLDGVIDFALGGSGWDPYVDGKPFTGNFTYGEPDLIFTSQSDLKWIVTETTGFSAWTHDIAVGDLNADGKDDVFSSSIMGDKSFISSPNVNGNYFYDRSRLPKLLTSQDIAFNYGNLSTYIDNTGATIITGSNFTGSTIFDVNNDGYSDLIVLPSSQTKNGFVFLNDKSGGFSDQHSISLPEGAYGYGGYNSSYQQKGTISLEGEALDVNSDGVMDMALLQTNSNQRDGKFEFYNGSTIQILTNDSSGKFTKIQEINLIPTSSPNFNFYYDIEVYDINRDGRPDIIVYGNPSDSNYYKTEILLNINGSFERATERYIPDKSSLYIPYHQNQKLNFYQYETKVYGNNATNLSNAIFTNIESDINSGVMISGSGSTENLIGSGANELFLESGGNDIVDGLSGTDSYKSFVKYIDTKIIKKEGYIGIQNGSKTVSLFNIERLVFSDKTIALDIDGIAGQAYRVYQAAFNRTPDNGGLKYWIGLMDGGYTLAGVASGFIASAEFKTLYGSNPTNELFVSKLYDNVLHRTPDIGGYNYWVGLLNTNKIDNISTLINFSESPENQAGVIGVIQNGIELLN